MKEINCICHSGVKGMKWGIRRFQNEDGTLTDAGKARYYDNGEKKKVENMSDKDLESATNRFNKENNYYNAKGDYYKTKGSIRNTALKTILAGVGTGVLTTGMLAVRDHLKSPYGINPDKSDEHQMMIFNQAQKMRRGKNVVAGIMAGAAASIVTASGEYGVNKITYPNIIK